MVGRWFQIAAQHFQETTVNVENWLQLVNILAVASVGLIGIYTARNLKTVSVSLDGRLEELLKLTAKSSHAEGMAQERKDNASSG